MVKEVKVTIDPVSKYHRINIGITVNRGLQMLQQLKDGPELDPKSSLGQLKTDLRQALSFLGYDDV